MKIIVPIVPSNAEVFPQDETSGYARMIHVDPEPPEPETFIDIDQLKGCVIQYENWARGDIANKEFLESIEKWKDLLNEFSNQIDRFNKLLLNFVDVLEKSNKEQPREDDPRPHLDVGIIKCPYEGCEGYLITTGVVDDIGEIYRCSACRKEFHGRDT